MIEGSPGIVPLLNGAVAGLAGITPASGFITPLATIVLSLILGFATYFGVKVLKDVLHVDDALDVTVVHGLTGIIGSIMVGFAATTEINPSGPNAVISGSPVQLGYQILGVVVGVLWAAFWTFVILKIIEVTVGLKVSEEEEERGLDAVEHNEVAYDYLVKVAGKYDEGGKDDELDIELMETNGAKKGKRTSTNSKNKPKKSSHHHHHHHHHHYNSVPEHEEKKEKMEKREKREKREIEQEQKQKHEDIIQDETQYETSSGGSSGSDYSSSDETKGEPSEVV